jgi:hypothetical protein
MTDGWRDPDLPDGVVRFPPEPDPRHRVRLAAVMLTALIAAGAWLLRTWLVR